MRISILLTVFFISGSTLSAQSTRSAVFRFLDIHPSARAASLGGNHPGMQGSDFSLMNINPAYMSAEHSGKWSATYVNYLDDANLGITNAAWHLQDIGTFGLSIRYLGYGDLTRFDEAGNDLGSFTASDVAITTAFSRAISEQIRFGLAADLIRSSYLTFSSNAIALSGGLLYTDPENDFSAGLSLRNAGAQVTTFADQREPLPLDISAGFSKKPEGFPFTLTFSMRKLNDWGLRIPGENEDPDLLTDLLRHSIFGGEANLGENLQIRFGYDHYLHEQTNTGKSIDLAGFAFGIGINIRSFQVDISRNAYSRIGGMTQISISTKLW